jgi:hypothetical protein
LKEEDSVPDFIRELDTLVVELVNRAVHIQESICHRVSDGDGDDSEHRLNRRGEVLTTEGDGSENRPDEHSDDGHKRNSRELGIRKRDKTQEGGNTLLEGLHENPPACEDDVQRHGDNTPDERRRLQEADEEHEKEGQLHQGAQIRRRRCLHPPASGISEKVSRDLAGLNGNLRNPLRFQEALQSRTLGARKCREKRRRTSF